MIMDKYFKVSIFFFFFPLKANLSSLKEKKKKKDTDFAMLYVVSLVLIMLGKFKINPS